VSKCDDSDAGAGDCVALDFLVLQVWLEADLMSGCLSVATGHGAALEVAVAEMQAALAIVS